MGGSLQSNPGAHVGLALSGVETASELAELMAATGLAQNLAALRALTTSGMSKRAHGAACTERRDVG